MSSQGWLDPYVSGQKTWWTPRMGSCMHLSVMHLVTANLLMHLMIAYFVGSEVVFDVQ
ncbi:hypothetical protein DL98DRAFT_518377 [Cadophora sp. DSE1049]|nr:hypothetical protein DL98DRAFT_518377 [Cadophora sp. DSE1049]